MDDSFKTKYNRLVLFYYRLIKLKKFTSQTVKTKAKNKIVYNNALILIINYSASILMITIILQMKKKKTKKRHG